VTVAALAGVDVLVTIAPISGPLAAGALLAGTAVPARSVVAGFDLVSDDLDLHAAPTLLFEVGDAADPDRLAGGLTVGRAGGLYEHRPASAAWMRYRTAETVRVRVAAPPATPALSGTVTLRLYAYPAYGLEEMTRLVLQGLGVLGEGETARAADAQLAREALAEAHEGLRSKRLARRGDLAWPVELVPLFAARPYAALAGHLLAPVFGLPAARQQVQAARAAEAEREMRRQTQARSAGGPVSLDPDYAEPAAADTVPSGAGAAALTDDAGGALLP